MLRVGSPAPQNLKKPKVILLATGVKPPHSPSQNLENGFHLPNDTDHRYKNPSWGRHAHPSWMTIINSALIMTFCPLITLFFWAVLEHHNGSIYNALHHLTIAVYSAQNSKLCDLVQWIITYFPKPNWVSFRIFIAWYSSQALMYLILPGFIGTGQRTPAGHKLTYKINGLSAWAISITMFIVGVYLGYWDMSELSDNWGGYLVWANIHGYLLTAFSYMKAYAMPSHPNDRKFSGEF